jgi:hypothetical protein
MTGNASTPFNGEANCQFNGSSLSVTGNITATSDVIAYYSSDKRFKDNIQTLTNVLDKLDKVRGVEFDWNQDQDTYSGHDIGVVAQEIEAAFPELVKDRVDGFKGVRYEKLTAVLLQAIKELKEKVETLEKQVNKA